MPRSIYLLILVCSGIRTTAQWDVPVHVEMNGDSTAYRQVTGVHAPLTPTAGVSARSERERSFLSGVATGMNDLTLSLTPPLDGYAPGLRVSIVPDSTNTGPVTLSIDGLPPVPVHKAVTLDLDSGDVRPHVPLLLIHDGMNFQVIGPIDPACDAGYFAISRDVCIERQPHGPNTFWQSLNYCHDHHARLCSFSEWFSACIHDNGLFSSIVDWEWVDHAANDADKSKLLGLNGTTLVPDCYGGGLRIPTATFHFRCCKDR
ncbi:MAG: hypothetical protein H6597_03690 [Flavobacteriales bacterium]|nr:hypothetical protein [Flavobacteriales bacterium]MCB9193611.1 hypothetical protein [Flavobacteriales bacterium]